MNIAVRYYTRSGNTKKLADAVGEALGVEAKNTSADLTEKADVLFLGTSMYAGSYDTAVKDFIEKNADKIGTVVNFGSSATGKSTLKKLEALCNEKGITVYSKPFACYGHFLFMHKNNPDENDCKNVKDFAVKVRNEFEQNG